MRNPGTLTRRLTVLVIVFAAALLFGRSLPAGKAARGDGTLDTSFGVDGKVITDFGAFLDLARSVAVQPNGKVVVAGSTISVAPPGNTAFALARYNNDGTLDASFGVDGKVTTDFGIFQDLASSVALQPNGKIVAAGFTTISVALPGNTAFALARYNNDGTLDTSFGVDGKVITDFGAFLDLASSVAVQPNGKVVAAGSTSITPDNRAFALARYNNDGTLDTSFDVDGKVITDFGAFLDQAFSVALQPNGKIVAAGSTTISGAPIDSAFALARYNNDGTLDTSFGVDGKVITDFEMFQDPALSVAVQPNGKVVAAGFTSSGPASLTVHSAFALARYNNDGTLDASFGVDGKVITDFGTFQDLVRSVAVQPNGKIVAAGSTTIGVAPIDSAFALARYNNNGTLDTSFGVDGKVITQFGMFQDPALSVAVQPNGKVVAVGSTSFGPPSPTADSAFALARYN